jgi:hypothetical protein
VTEMREGGGGDSAASGQGERAGGREEEGTETRPRATCVEHLTPSHPHHVTQNHLALLNPKPRLSPKR